MLSPYRKTPFDFDGYLLADASTVATVVLFFLFITKKASPKYMAIGMLVTALLLLYQMILGKTVVENNLPAPKNGEGGFDENGTPQGNVVFAKDEKSSYVLKIYPKESIRGIDGIYTFDPTKTKASYKPEYSVYKIPDGVHATVKEDYNVKVRSLWGRLIYKVRGGLLTAPPDKDWEPLFNPWILIS